MTNLSLLVQQCSIYIWPDLGKVSLFMFCLNFMFWPNFWVIKTSTSTSSLLWTYMVSSHVTLHLFYWNARESTQYILICKYVVIEMSKVSISFHILTHVKDMYWLWQWHRVGLYLINSSFEMIQLRHREQFDPQLDLKSLQSLSYCSFWWFFITFVTLFD